MIVIGMPRCVGLSSGSLCRSIPKDLGVSPTRPLVVSTDNARSLFLRLSLYQPTFLPTLVLVFALICTLVFSYLLVTSSIFHR